MKIIKAFNDDRLLSGITQVDNTEFPWPGYSFSISPATTPEHVEMSYLALARELDVDRERIVTVHQVHGTEILVADSRTQAQADALITTTPGLIVGVKLADCCGVLMYDASVGVVAAIHSGWRGTAGNIVGKTIEILTSRFKTKTSDIRVWLSPCASGSHYEVGEDVFQVLAKHCTPLGSKWLFDNHQAIRDQCFSAGIGEQNIDVRSECTITDEQWHSYRRDGERSGRMLAFIGLRFTPEKSQ